MKIVHIADVHWRGLSRHDEYRESFEDFFNQCRSLSPDIIYVGGDIVHSKTQGISPELIDNLSWWFTNLANIAPTHVILGNHDGLILNKDRQDAITPIITMLNNPNIFLYKKSGIYPIDNSGYNWCVFSCFDEENWDKVKPIQGDINIALYHGAVKGSLSDTDWQLEGEINHGMFKGYDFALLGDIHKKQFLNEEKTIAYCGSTIQQNYGESEEKGFLFWDIRGKNDFNVEFYPVLHRQKFITLSWQGSFEKTVKKCEEYEKGVRFRIRTNQSVTHIECKRLQQHLTKHLKASEVVFKSESTFDPRRVMVENATLSQHNLRDSNTHKKMFREYYKDNIIDKKTWDNIDNLIEKYVDQLEGKDETLRNIQWTINKIEFDNMFSYGENNIINFDKLPGITGIFGTNAKGKSSIIGSIVYALFNDTDRGSIKNLHVINTRKNMCKTSIYLTINGHKYQIDRRTIKKDSKNGPWAPTNLNFYRLDKQNNIIEDLTEEQRRETEKIIRNLIGNSYDFLLTSLASQGEMNTFIKEKATARKQILTNFLDLEVFDQLYEFIRKDSQEIKLRFRSLEGNNWENRISDCQNDIKDFKSKIGTTKKNIKNVKEEIDKLKDELRSNNSSHILASDVEKSHNEILDIETKIAKDEDRLDELSDILSDYQEKLDKLTEFLDGYVIEDLREKRKYQNELEISLKDMNHKIDLLKKDISQSKKSIAILDQVPCGDSFPTCKFIKNSHKSKKELIDQEANLIAMNTNLRDIKSLYNKVKDSDIEEKIDKYEKLIDKKNNIVNLMSNYKIESTKIKENMKWQNEKLVKLQGIYERKLSLFNSQENDDDISEISLLCDEKINILKSLESEKEKYINKLAEKNALLKTLKSNKILYDKLKEENRCFDLIGAAVSKKGIPLHIINKMLPAINSEISKILSGVVQFTVDIDSDLETNSLDVYINYGDSRRIIELASGMEKMMASLAIRVALINVSSLSKTNMLIIDEGFGSLDETNLESCNRLLSSLKKWFKNIIVISHVDAIKDCVDNNIEILKKGKNSYVSFE